MRSKIIKKILAETPEETKIFVAKYADLVVLINSILREKGYTKVKLASQLGKQPSEIHKWLSGDHNFTLKSICKLEAELEESLLVVPKRPSAYKFEKMTCSVTYRAPADKQENLPKGVSYTWSLPLKMQKQCANVG